MPHTSTQPQLSAELTENSRRAAFHWKRLFGEINPYDSIVWEKRTAKIERGDGTVVFEQKDVEVPSFWTQTATDIVASKYFRGRLGTPERETSARQMVDRVVDEIGRWGWEDGYFASETDAENFKQDLKWILGVFAVLFILIVILKIICGVASTYPLHLMNINNYLGASWQYSKVAGMTTPEILIL